MMVVAILGVAGLLAYANGANDVGKGIATLVGSGVGDYRRAVAWGVLWTAAGGLLGAALAGAMLATFGNGLMAPGTTPTFAAALAALLGAAAWVLVATRAALPVSTTHAIVGSLVGASMLAYGAGGVRWEALGAQVFLPLLASPLVSLALVATLGRASRVRSRGGSAADCLCAEMEPVPVGVAGSAAAAVVALRVHTCRQAERSGALGLTLDHAHWATAGLASLARGMNDAPKMVALGLSASMLGGAALSTPLLFLVVTGAMVAGSLAAGRRVTRVLADKVTPMDPHEGFAANLVTAALVGAGAVYGLPMSTTHVSGGAIFGAGAERGSLDKRTLRDIVLAWIVTLPAAALLGAGAFVGLRLFGR